MAKKENNPVEEQQPVESGTPAFLNELLENGTATVTATSREELNELVNDIPVEVAYGVGAIGFNHETRLYSLRIDITNK